MSGEMNRRGFIRGAGVFAAAACGLVGPFMTCYDKSGKTQVIRGLFNEIVEKLVARGAAIYPRDCMGGTAFTNWIKVGHDHCTPFEPEALKMLLELRGGTLETIKILVRKWRDLAR